MSQFFIDATNDTPPPVVATSYVTDDGTAIPLANVLNVNGIDSTENNANGILTRADPDGSNNLQIIITNRLQGTISTTGAVTGNLITFALGAGPGTYAFEIRIAGFEATTPASVGYSLFGTIRTSGAAASIVGTIDRINNEDAALTGANATIIASGNDAIIQVTGVLGLTLNWSGVGLYTFVGA